mmetsp:Transcript_23845/g.34977  ORF Transcript_23845/g.34977 Transcript_23845/m.34977 type:complete len:180 (-) Transcript_23845:138-677(-)
MNTSGDINRGEVGSHQTPQKPSIRVTLSEQTTPKNRISPFLLTLTPERESERSDCPICLSPLENKIDREVTETQCKHLFHLACLHEFKTRNRSDCPVCRRKLTPLQWQQETEGVALVPDVADRLTAAYIISEGTTQQQIVSAARRGRNAVRMAMERRRIEQEIRTHEQEITQGFAISAL